MPCRPIEQHRHNDTGEDYADSPIKRQLFGREIVVAVTDGRRRKRVLVKIIGETGRTYTAGSRTTARSRGFR